MASGTKDEQTKDWSVWARLCCLLRSKEDPIVKDKRDKEEQAKKDAEPVPKTLVSSAGFGFGRAENKIEYPAAPPASAAPAGGSESSGLGGAVWKFVGAAAAAIGAAGFLTAVGGAVFWIRFETVDLPAAQSVGLVPKTELLAEGAQQGITFVAIGLAAVLLLYLIDPKGKMTRGPLGLLVALAIVTAIVVPAWADVGTIGTAMLIALPLALLVAVVVVGVYSLETFWPLALAVFAASLILAATATLLIVGDREYAQGVAVLRSDTDSGLTGLYISVGEKNVYIGQPLGEDVSRGVVSIAREGTTVAVGQLTTLTKAEADATRLLEELKSDRARNPPAAAAPAPTAESSGDSASDAPRATETTEAAKPIEATKSIETEPPTAQVAEAFTGPVVVHRTVGREATCLVRYTAQPEPGQADRLGHWWTTCGQDKQFHERSMFEIRDDLALPGRFSRVYDERVEGTLKIGAPIFYLSGRAAPQCEHAVRFSGVPDRENPPAGCGHFYRGGARQIYLPEPRVVEPPKIECTSTRQDQIPKWGTC